VRGRDSKKWGFPKGHMENGEIEEETARREFYEETGLEIFGPFDGRVRYGNNIYFFKTQVENRDLQIKDMNEIDEIQWLSKIDILLFHKEQCNFGLSMWRKYLASKTEDKTDYKTLNRKDYILDNIKNEDSVENSFQFPILYHYIHPEKKWFDRLSIPVRN
jgi:ADP-ribose pyrophosphatase YjhB (NUDIX family)